MDCPSVFRYTVNKIYGISKFCLSFSSNYFYRTSKFWLFFETFSGMLVRSWSASCTVIFDPWTLKLHQSVCMNFKMHCLREATCHNTEIHSTVSLSVEHMDQCPVGPLVILWLMTCPHCHCIGSVWVLCSKCTVSTSGFQSFLKQQKNKKVSICSIICMKKEKLEPEIVWNDECSILCD